MAMPAPGRRIIEISEEAFDVLARTAESQRTDFDGALRYLMRAPALPTTRQNEEPGEDE